VSVEDFGSAHASFAHDGLDARQRQLQFHRLRRHRHKQAALGSLRLHRFDGEPDMHDGRGRRMRRQIELQQLQKRFGIERRHGQPQRALMRGAGFQLQPQPQLIGGQAARGQAYRQPVDEPRQHEGQRLQQLHRILQLQLVFETERLGKRRQLALGFAARQLAQMETFRAEALGDAQRRQSGHVVETADAPALQGFLQFRRRAQQGQRQRAQKFRLVAIRNNADAGKSARRADGRIRVGGQRETGFDSHFRSAPRDGDGNILRQTEETVEAGSVQRDGVGSGLLHHRRKFEGQRG
jgi:hypothetical protein